MPVIKTKCKKLKMWLHKPGPFMPYKRNEIHAKTAKL